MTTIANKLTVLECLKDHAVDTRAADDVDVGLGMQMWAMFS